MRCDHRFVKGTCVHCGNSVGGSKQEVVKTETCAAMPEAVSIDERDLASRLTLEKRREIYVAIEAVKESVAALEMLLDAVTYNTPSECAKQLAWMEQVVKDRKVVKP